MVEFEFPVSYQETRSLPLDGWRSRQGVANITVQGVAGGWELRVKASAAELRRIACALPDLTFARVSVLEERICSARSRPQQLKSPIHPVFLYAVEQLLDDAYAGDERAGFPSPDECHFGPSFGAARWGRILLTLRDLEHVEVWSFPTGHGAELHYHELLVEHGEREAALLAVALQHASQAGPRLRSSPLAERTA